MFIKATNNTMLVGLLSLLIGLWLLLYIIPNLLLSLFHTLLGNLILLLFFILTVSQNLTLGLLLGFGFIILYRFSSMKKEGFTAESTNKFLLLQQTTHPRLVYDMRNLSEQVTQTELDNYIEKTGMWTWSQEVQDLYREAVKKNPFIRSNVDNGDVEQARKIYSEKAILEILALQNKEGQFLANGLTVLNKDDIERDGLGSYNISSGLQPFSEGDSIIRCDANVLQEIKYKKRDPIFSTRIYEKTDLKNEELEKVIPGFKFSNGNCNPCSALSGDYSCPFTVDSFGSTSNVWKHLWGLN